MENNKQLTGQQEGQTPVMIIKPMIEKAGWNDIAAAMKREGVRNALPVGTEIEFNLKNGAPAMVQVIGHDHYEEGDTVFWFRQVLGFGSMNDERTNEGGFPACKMRSVLDNEYFPLLPDELQDLIRTHTVRQKIDGEIVECQAGLFLPSEYEFSGEGYWSEYNGEDTQFAWMAKRTNRVAHDEDGDPVWYWTADPSEALATDFCDFYSNGYSSNRGASLEGGIAPLFVLNP